METGNPLLLSFTNTLKLYKDLLVTNVGFEPFKSAVFNSAVLVQMKSQVSKCMLSPVFSFLTFSRARLSTNG